MSRARSYLKRIEDGLRYEWRFVIRSAKLLLIEGLYMVIN